MATTISPAALQGGVALTTTLIPVVLVSAPARGVVKRAVFSNFSSSAVSISVSILRVGGSANSIITARPIPAGLTDLAPELASMVLNPGDMIEASCSVSGAVNCFVSGYTVV